MESASVFRSATYRTEPAWAETLRLLVFTDLDGTLLDHATYAHDRAKPALRALRALDVPLILASSKTGAEIARLHDELQLGDCPAIVENGAGLYTPGGPSSDDNSDYLRIRQALSDLPPDLSRFFQGFGDMSDKDVAATTGLPLDQARLARMRCHSEPGLWSGTDADLSRFLDALKTRGIAARRGGRFLTLSFGRTKADAMKELTDRLHADVTIALGDAPNDAEMLAAADHGVVVRNDHAPPMPEFAGEATGRIRRTTLPGPAGWNAAILELIEDLGLTREQTNHG